ncbi:universal stress protein A [Stenotrophomonas maltophilia]|uniref:Universal stress protein A n=1 Tax=Stenotrophomonas maltophilia TaxID=40324 RepID=A0A246HI63_STEMA|nr:MULTISPECIES: universal stress protein [Pseudomonadota]MBH1755635.1 universal stress protein [Stenotrophomonas maltophilia]MBH1810619.1 universal stress protein [Stenotrophomonas maltophilia]OWQ50056.1 universal stress protein A [Stenotrophomonas maltophilia]WAT86296.1 universal stress protein [Delftia acidovorans]
MKTIVSCIDGSRSTIAVCDYSAWASLRLAAPLTLLHVLEQASQVSSDLTGNIGLDSRENLLQELAKLDEKRGRLAREHGQSLLEAATRCLDQLGVVHPNLLQRHGNLVDTLKAMEDDIRLLVIGRQGEHGQSKLHHIGGNVESVIRTLQCPVLVIPTEFVKPQRFLVAFDGSANGRRVVEHLVRSPLLNGLHCHLLMVVESSVEHQAQLEWATDELQRAGYTTHATISQGDVEDVLKTYCQEHAISLLAMGAYGHSRIRQFLVGSTTTSMLRWAKLPLLLLH